MEVSHVDNEGETSLLSPSPRSDCPDLRMILPTGRSKWERNSCLPFIYFFVFVHFMYHPVHLKYESQANDDLPPSWQQEEKDAEILAVLHAEIFGGQIRQSSQLFSINN